jgi:hypothetical protein
VGANGLTDQAVLAIVKKEYFTNQFIVIPHDGDNVTVGDAQLTWHAEDTKLYNLNLYRFAHGLDKPTTNVLFWAVTLVNCPREMPGVRLDSQLHTPLCSPGRCAIRLGAARHADRAATHLCAVTSKYSYKWTIRRNNAAVLKEGKLDFSSGSDTIEISGDQPEMIYVAVEPYAKLATDASASARPADTTAGFGTFVRTAGSCPGMINFGLAASCFIPSCARTFDGACHVAAISTCFSRFSYRYMLSLAKTTIPAFVFTPTNCDAYVCLPPV